MTIGRGEKIGFVLVLLSFGVAALLYPRLPDPVPTHWSSISMAQPDGWTPKPWGAFFGQMVMAFVWVVTFVLGRALGGQMKNMQRPWQTVVAAVMILFFVMTTVNLWFIVDHRVPVNRVIAACGGALFMVLGNVMGKLTRNDVFGIRTPWTLSSDEVWVRTHQMGGKLMVISGAALLLSAAAGWPLIPALVLLALGLAATIVYSYRTYRKLEIAKSNS